MALTAPPRPRARPAHTQGPTRCAYTPAGSKLVTVGSNNTIRLYKTGFDGEPINIDDCQEQNVAVASCDDFFVVGSEDGTLSLYSIPNAAFDKFLTRTTLPIRDVALSPDSKWCAVASDELTVKIVNTSDNSKLRHLKAHNKPTKHLTFSPKGDLVALSCTDGIVYVYDLGIEEDEEPELIRRVDSIIGSVDTESEICTKAVWHPDGRAFALPTPTRDIQVVSKNDWEKQRAFNGHTGDITALSWSPNGAMLASAGKDKKILLWDTKTQNILSRYDFTNVMDIAWHPTNNTVSFTNSDGEVYIHPDFVPEQHLPLLKLSAQPAPFIHDPLSEISANARRPEANGFKSIPARPRRLSAGSYDSLMDGPLPEDDDFVVDDDGAGYVVNANGKRMHEGLDPYGPYGESSSKRRNVQTEYHEAFQPGSTPWRGNRKYLCLNLIGFIWTVDQDGHHTVTVEFYDHEFQRDFHFTDTFLYDKACLTENGAVFSCPPNEDQPATIFYRPHETWTHRTDWRTELPKGEAVLAISLSKSFVTVITTANYVRVYTLFGIPYRVYRPKSSPMVTCASWRDYVMTIGNGPVGGDGRTRLLYTIENLKGDDICQNEDTVALPPGATLKSVFFSDKGDPCIYDSTGTLLTLLHWRKPSKALWVPLLDTTLLPRLASGRKTETYFPIAVADNRFHCIILKGGDQYPYFPRPLLSEFDFSVPLTSEPPKQKSANIDAMEDDEADNDDGDSESRKLEQQYLLKSIAAAQTEDLANATDNNFAQSSALTRLELEIDKALLQLLAIECREGEERGMRALELVDLMRDRSGRMVEAAGKIAERYGRTILGDKIRDVGGKRIQAMDDDDF
ncbi:minichromosome loss protein [Xylariaceae sp. FL1019]|nr:minichromosome loss protein [Xylariaceae sp. FL1019]